MTRPVTAAANTATECGAPAGSANPRVSIEDPAAVNAVPMLPWTSGHISSQYPMNAVPSQAAS